MTYDDIDGVHLSPTPRLLKTVSIHVTLSSLCKSMQRKWNLLGGNSSHLS